MKATFILFHCESVNEDRDAVCHFIAVPVINGERQAPKEFFFNPEAHYLSVMSGLTEKQVKSFPSLSDEWPKIQTLLDSFDIAVCSAEGYSARAMYATLMRLNVPFNHIRYCNAKAICRRTMNELSYSLDYLSYVKFNDAVYYDEPVLIAERWCDLVLMGLSKREESSLTDFLNNVRITHGDISPDNFISSNCRPRHYDERQTFDPSGIEIEAKPNNPLYGMNVVFTGKLESLKRDEARSLVIKIGGFAPEGLTAKTNYLVVGVQDLRVVGEKGLSNKMKAAAKYKDKGLPIEIIDEKDFLEMINE